MSRSHLEAEFYYMCFHPGTILNYPCAGTTPGSFWFSGHPRVGFGSSFVNPPEATVMSVSKSWITSVWKGHGLLQSSAGVSESSLNFNFGILCTVWRDEHRILIEVLFPWEQEPQSSSTFLVMSAERLPTVLCRQPRCSGCCWNQLAAPHRMQQDTAGMFLTGESGVRLHVSLSEGYHQRQIILKLMSTILILQIKKWKPSDFAWGHTAGWIFFLYSIYYI